MNITKVEQEVDEEKAQCIFSMTQTTLEISSGLKLGFTEISYHVPSLLKQRSLGLPACHPDTLTGHPSHPEDLCPRTAAVSGPPQILWRGASVHEVQHMTKTQRFAYTVQRFIANA